MQPTFQLDDRAFTAALQRLAALPGKAAGPVLRQQAGLFAVDCMRLTPPTGKGPFTESFAAQHAAGRRALAHDMQHLFRDPRELGALKKNPKALKWVNLYMRNGQIDKLASMLKRMHIKGQVIPAATLEIHKASLGANGRPLRNRFFFVLSASSVKSVTKTLDGHLGHAKSGFLAAALKFGAKAKIPNWISSHTTKGIAIDASAGGGPQLSVTIGNPVPAAQKFGRKLRLMQRALERRAQSMSHQLEAALKRGMQ